MIPLAMAAIQTGIGLSQVAAGANKQSRALRDREVAIGDLEDTRYADYNQAYYNELQRRESVGLPEAQRQYMEQQAERAAGVGLAATEDRRAGIMGIGYQEQMQLGQLDLSLSEQARQEGLSQQQAGLQSTMTGLGQIGTMASGGGQTPDLYGQGTTQAPVNQFSNYTPPQNLSLSQNNSPFATASPTPQATTGAWGMYGTGWNNTFNYGKAL
jgi:hypothetical protein